MFNASAWSIKTPTPALLLFVMLTLAGLVSFWGMRIQDFPDVELPMVIVSTQYPGAAPAQIEAEVTRKLENALGTLQGVKHIYSSVQDGFSQTTIEFVLEKNLLEALEETRNAVSAVRADLPGEVKDPIIGKVEFSGVPFMVYTVRSARRDEEALSWLVDDALTRALMGVPGLGRVSRVGGSTRAVQVLLDPERLSAWNVSAAELSHQLQAVQRDASGGAARLGGQEQAVHTINTTRRASELAALDLPLSDGRHVRLGDIARIVDGPVERRSIALHDDQPVVAFELVRSRGASEVAVVQEVEAVLQRFALSHPDLHFAVAYDMVEPVRESFSGSMSLLYEGALLAVLVVWWFLRDGRATLISAAALPLSLIPTFIGMALFDFTLNTVTLLSLALVVGILVDDAIVEIENIVRHLRMGKTPYQAALEAANEIGLAVIATTLALVAVFLPTAFMNGIAGKFFKQFGWTSALAVLASLLVARLLTPMMAAYLLRSPSGPQPSDPPWMRRYLQLVERALHHRFFTLLASAGFFLASLFLLPLLPTGFVPPDDRSQTVVRLELPPGTPFADTLERARQAQAILKKEAEVEHIYLAIGGGSAGADVFAGGDTNGVNQASLTLTLQPRQQRNISKVALEQRFRERLEAVPGVRIAIGLGNGGEKFQLVLKGEATAQLEAAARRVEAALRTLPGIGAIRSSASLERPEVQILPDRTRAAELGVTHAALAETVRIATTGDYDVALAKLNLDNRQLPIIVRLDDPARQDLHALGSLAVPAREGPVRLDQVARLGLGSAPALLSRMDRARNVNIDVELNGHTLGELSAAIDALPELQHLPAGVTRAEVGDAEEMKTLFASFGLAMLTGVLCIYMVLVLLFHDFMQPITILAALPLSIGGAFLALFLTQSAFSMPSLIGLIMLMGIASKNSILLVEYAIVARRQGQTRRAALLDACHKRARPILMTTLAMGAGMLPIALGLGIDPSFRAPMAIAVIGGLITSTLLSLLVVPVVFTYVDDLHLRLLAWRRTPPPPAKSPEPPDPPAAA